VFLCPTLSHGVYYVLHSVMVFITSYTQSWCLLGPTLSHGVFISSYTQSWCLLGPTLSHGVY